MNTKNGVLRHIPNIYSSDAFIFMIRHWIRQRIDVLLNVGWDGHVSEAVGFPFVDYGPLLEYFE